MEIDKLQQYQLSDHISEPSKVSYILYFPYRVKKSSEWISMTFTTQEDMHES